MIQAVHVFDANELVLCLQREKIGETAMGINHLAVVRSGRGERTHNACLKEERAIDGVALEVTIHKVDVSLLPVPSGTLTALRRGTTGDQTSKLGHER